MLIKTMAARLAAALGTAPRPYWQNRHPYLLSRDPKTGAYVRTYLDLKFRYLDGRPYFVPAEDQDGIAARDGTPKRYLK